MAPKFVTILGMKRLERKLRRMSDVGVPRALNAATGVAMTEIARGFRSAINSTPNATQAQKSKARKRSRASSFRNLKREASATIGRTARKAKGGTITAKAGFAVGRRGKARKKAIAKSMSRRGKNVESGKSRGRGVGVSAQNIHWFVLGTRRRRQNTTRRRTGKLGAIFKGVARKAFAMSSSKALRAAKSKIRDVIAKEARKG